MGTVGPWPPGPADQLTGVRDTGTAGAQLAQKRQVSAQDSEDSIQLWRAMIY